MLGFSSIGGASIGANPEENAIPAIAPGAILTGTSIIAGGYATGNSGGMAPGATLTSTANIIGGPATSANYARAPSGGGYPARAQSNQSRPANIQESKR